VLRWLQEDDRWMKEKDEADQELEDKCLILSRQFRALEERLE